MKPLVLNYFSIVEPEKFDSSNLEYCPKQNLTIDKTTQRPAISYASMPIETSTKVQMETSDNKTDKLGIYLSTKTKTFTQMESSDADPTARPKYS